MKALDIAVFEFDDFPTPGADEMIVVALMRNIVVLRLSPEVPGLGETCFTKEVECAVNGCQPQMGILPRQLVVHLFSRDMFLFQKCVEDQFALASKLQLVLSKMLLENFHFFGMFRHGE